MVFYFLSKVVDPPVVIYMGADKFENEELLKFGFPEDIWFHVDDLSSAHVYLRPHSSDFSIDDIPELLLADCAQLVKANSIEGSKLASVKVVYTPFTNLKKTSDMEVGQVGFHDRKKLKYFMIEKKNNDIVKRLNKTKEERAPNLRQEKEERDRRERHLQRKKREEERQRQKEEREQAIRDEEIRTYKSIMSEDNMTSNKMTKDFDYKQYEEDFM